MTDTKVSCSYENGSYVIKLYGDESLLDPKEIFFENEELLVNKENVDDEESIIKCDPLIDKCESSDIEKLLIEKLK